MADGKGSVNSVQFSPFQGNLIAVANERLTIWNIVSPAEYQGTVGRGHKCGELGVCARGTPVSDRGLRLVGQQSLDLGYRLRRLRQSPDGYLILAHPGIGGGSLHIFRPMDLLTMPEEEAVQKFDQYMEH